MVKPDLKKHFLVKLCKFPNYLVTLEKVGSD